MSGEVRVLVATDVAARGIHVDDIAMVIQVDPPEEYKTYLAPFRPYRSCG